MARNLLQSALMGVRRFEDLRVWQAAKRFCDEIGALIHKPGLCHDFALRNQLNAAAISVVANIAEGFLHNRPKEFTRYLRIAAASNGEARALLYVAHTRRYLTDSELNRLMNLNILTGKMLRRFRDAMTSAAEP